MRRFSRLVPVLASALLGPAPADAVDAVAVVVRDAKGALVADAVVSLVPLDAPVPPPGATAPAEIAQEDEQYHPFLTIVRVGATVLFPNKDRIQHHLYSVSEAKRFEKPLYAPGAHETVVFDRPGVVTLGCNIHDWMVAYVVVLETPWFARTGPDGAAQLSAPPGRYRLDVWHPRLIDPRSRRAQSVPVSREVRLPAGGPEEFALTLAPDRRIRRAPADNSTRY